MKKKLRNQPVRLVPNVREHTQPMAARANRAHSPQLRLLSEDGVPRRRFHIAGLFAGIGGIELGLHRAGHATSVICEVEPGARAVLDEGFPKIRKHDDIRTLKRLPGDVDLVAAGFPCQDLSQAGKTAGIAGARSGLVGEVFRLLQDQRVPWVLLENVPFMLQLGRGKALEVIVAAFESLGYRWAYRVVDSRAFGVPQRRERVYFLASTDGDPRTVLFEDDTKPPRASKQSQQRVACGFYWTEGIRGLGWAVDAVPTLKGGSAIGIPSPPAILLPSGDIVKPDIRDAERMQGFTVDWTRPSEAVMRSGHRWKLVGNAVTVDAAAWLGERLALPGSYDGSKDLALAAGAKWPRAAWSMGAGRFASNVSAFPVRKPSPSLHAFLKFPTVPLSVKATAGFLARARTSTLHFPEGFLEAVEAHLERVQGLEAVAV